MQYALVVVDSSVFKQNFDAYRELPAPESDLGQDLVWEKPSGTCKGRSSDVRPGLSECRLENPEATKARIRDGPQGSVLAVHRSVSPLDGDEHLSGVGQRRRHARQHRADMGN
ncbi:hypothetical protein, partial [Mesorhizobium sp.]|uniref:hypothetical protein n=1 Tax=Mesorhizobium sp. TaxID=1871066 RepID=UPI002579DC1B